MRHARILQVNLSLLTAMLFLASCSGGAGSPRGSFDASQIEFLTRDEVVREDVENHPRQFEVAQAERAVLWKRVNILSKEQVNTNSSLTVLKAPSISGFHVRHFPGERAPAQEAQSNQGVKKQFAYEIIARSRGPNTLLVEVAAVNTQTGQPDVDSDLLARNIARFLKSGVFERSLL